MGDSTLQALSGFGPEEILQAVSPIARFRAKQIFKWIARGAADFDEMTDLPVSLRAELSARFRVRSGTVSAALDAEDGTKKLQIALGDGAKIEAVLLVDGEGRKTACLSSQVGCPMRCAFCKTGTLGFLRNLSAGEMVDQFLFLQDSSEPISNIVVMGMGEPLLNLKELRRAVGVLSHPDGLGFSKRRFTVSTCGIIAGVRELAEEGPDVRLAVSLTTADRELRERLMPVTKSDPLPDLKAALLEFQRKREKRITLEAVLLGGVNTRVADADAMAEFARGLDAVVNLIPWNPVDELGLDGVGFAEPSEAEVLRFERLLEARKLLVTRRFRKGRGVSGACGQLGSVLSEDD